MEPKLEVLFTPAEFDVLKHRDLSNTICVVFDVLRATTSMLTALQNGARQIHPVKEIAEAVALRNGAAPDALLAGERHGLRIRAGQTGGVDFDLGNSPREFTCDRVAGRTLIMTTTNGTRALQACLGAREILVGAFLNLAALAEHISQAAEAKPDLLVVCAGTFEDAAYEDTLAAGALCDVLWRQFPVHVDSAAIARQIYLVAQGDLGAAFQEHSTNARRLLSIPDLRDDVAFALRINSVSFAAALKDGIVARSV